MQFVASTLLLAATAGMWFWVVKSRGALNLWLANLAGAVASFIVGTAVLILCSSWFSPETPSSPVPAYALYTLMACLGVFIGTWLLIIGRFKRDEYPVIRHVIAAACSCVTAMIAVVTWVLVLSGK